MTVEERLERIERLMVMSTKNVFTSSEVALLLGISEGRIRHLTSKREIPHYKQGKKTFFKKSEIEAWQLEQRIPTNAEIDGKAEEYLLMHRK